MFAEPNKAALINFFRYKLQHWTSRTSTKTVVRKAEKSEYTESCIN